MTKTKRPVRRPLALSISMLVLAFAPLACEDPEPAPTSTARSDGAPGDAGGEVAAAMSCGVDEPLAPVVSATACAADPMDYTPRVSASATDSWPACVSDGNEYLKFDESISSLGRVNAFEQIATLLGFGTGKSPTPAEFTEARVVYTQNEGIESRVSRREDEHYPAVAKLCREMTAEEQQANADRCVGPAKIRPILNDAFLAGMNGADPVANAARIEAALLWFFYSSVFKEATTAAAAPRDTDSMWAKYTGGQPRGGARGLSRYVLPRSQLAHDRIWDGLLAVRCWRDLDNPTGPASNLALRDRARSQLDRALLYGMAVILRQRISLLPCTPTFEGAKILGRVLAREAQLRDPTAAAVLAGELGKGDPALVDRAALTAAIDQLFPCP